MRFSSLEISKSGLAESESRVTSSVEKQTRGERCQNLQQITMRNRDDLIGFGVHTCSITDPIPHCKEKEVNTH